MPLSAKRSLFGRSIKWTSSSLLFLSSSSSAAHRAGRTLHIQLNPDTTTLLLANAPIALTTCHKQAVLYKRCGHVIVVRNRCEEAEARHQETGRSSYCNNKMKHYENYGRCKKCSRKQYKEGTKPVPVCCVMM
jgi:hypothetical protein